MKTNVTNMKLAKNEDANYLARCSIVIEDAIAINDIWIVDTKKGVRVNFPQRPYEKDGEIEYASIVAPITKEAREELTSLILKAYDEAVNAKSNQVD